MSDEHSDHPSLDLEDCDNMYKGVVGCLLGCAEEDMTVNSYLNPDYRRFQSHSYSNSPQYEMPSDIFDMRSNLTGFVERTAEDYFNPLVDYADEKRTFNDLDLPTYGISSLSDMESDLFVSPDSILPNSPKKIEDIASLDSMYPDLGFSDTKFIKVEDCVDEDYGISLEDIFGKNKPRKFTHLDIDHCYSQRPPVQYDDDEEEDDDDYFNSSPYSPASSSCSDYAVAASGGVKRKCPKRIVRRKKIKKEVLEGSEDEEVDVETPCTIPPLVPKIIIAITPPPTPPTPAKRGRKPKGQNLKKNKNCPVSAKILHAAIKQQTKKSYVTKSGRVTKISNSVETTPSTSTPSSVNNSRYNSDSEDNVDKRASHNMAERNRRQELTNLFQQLRQKVPEIKKNLKASKVLILQSSSSHISDLEEIGNQKVFLKEQLKAEIEKKLALVQSFTGSKRCFS